MGVLGAGWLLSGGTGVGVACGGLGWAGLGWAHAAGVTRSVQLSGPDDPHDPLFLEGALLTWRPPEGSGHLGWCVCRQTSMS